MSSLHPKCFPASSSGYNYCSAATQPCRDVYSSSNYQEIIYPNVYDLGQGTGNRTQVAVGQSTMPERDSLFHYYCTFRMKRSQQQSARQRSKIRVASDTKTTTAAAEEGMNDSISTDSDEMAVICSTKFPQSPQSRRPKMEEPPSLLRKQ